MWCPMCCLLSKDGQRNVSEGVYHEKNWTKTTPTTFNLFNYTKKEEGKVCGLILLWVWVCVGVCICVAALHSNLGPEWSPQAGCWREVRSWWCPRGSSKVVPWCPPEHCCLPGRSPRGRSQCLSHSQGQRRRAGRRWNPGVTPRAGHWWSPGRS